ncbi:MAG: lipoprotein [Agarilytica sp.]
MIRRLNVIFAMCFTLTACGQTGDLRLPEADGDTPAIRQETSAKEE